ncbi:MAG: tRNA lysidine(34) synthetase TilS [Bacilli bacterium]|nr:tRNA lysidine(34) synthetase TilS [Bacilli bacterium]
MKEEKEYLAKLLNNKTVIVSCSGGPDSMALLSIVNDIKDDNNIKVIVAHVNHKVRVESDEEALMVETYAEEFHDIFELLEIKNYHEKVNFHEDARKIRYKFLKELTDKYNADFLLTAHHGDDLTETILMRITRGSSLKGYIGFKQLSNWEGIKLVRPLIRRTKKYLEEYDKENNIPYRIDNTNFSSDYTRNRYRNNIIPLLKEEDENIHLKYLKFSKELDKYYEYVKKEADMIKKDISDKNGEIIVSKYIKIPSLLKEMIISDLIIERQLIDYLPLNDALFTDMLKILESDKSNAFINLPNNYLFGKEYDRVVFKKIEEKANIIDYELEKEYAGEIFDIYFSDKYDSSNNSIALNKEEIKLPLKVRSKKDGDYIETLNLNGKKKISDIFIDAKVPKNLRNKYPLVVDANDNILWVPGLKKSKFAKANDEKYDIILNCKEKKDESKK